MNKVVTKPLKSLIKIVGKTPHVISKKHMRAVNLDFLPIDYSHVVLLTICKLVFLINYR